MRTVTIYLRGVAEDDSDIVQHRGFFDESAVHESLLLPFGVRIDDTQRAVSHLPAVRHEDMP